MTPETSINISTTGVAKRGLPDGFVYIDEVIPDCIVDARYWGTDNLLGRNIDGYEEPLAIMSREAAEGCLKAAQSLRKRGCLLKIFDAYRPRRAVAHLARWCEDAADVRRKPIHYPNISKAALLELGYISLESGHSRGGAVDLTIVDVKTAQEVDMGSIFDFMDARSHIGAAGLTEAQLKNRLLLQSVMRQCGFVPYEKEWWHFDLEREPYRDSYFDFPVA